MLIRNTCKYVTKILIIISEVCFTIRNKSSKLGIGRILDNYMGSCRSCLFPCLNVFRFKITSSVGNCSQTRKLRNFR